MESILASSLACNKRLEGQIEIACIFFMGSLFSGSKVCLSLPYTNPSVYRWTENPTQEIQPQLFWVAVRQIRT